MCIVGVIHTHYPISIGGEGNKHSLFLVEEHSSRFIIIFTIGSSQITNTLPGEHLTMSSVKTTSDYASASSFGTTFSTLSSNY